MSPIEYLLSKNYGKSAIPLINNGKLKQIWKVGSKKFNFFLQLANSSWKKFQPYLSVNKFKSNYSGPFRIIRVNENGVTYLLFDERNNKEIRAHHNYLALYNELPSYISDNAVMSKTR